MATCIFQAKFLCEKFIFLFTVKSVNYWLGLRQFHHDLLDHSNCKDNNSIGMWGTPLTINISYTNFIYC